MIDNIIAVDFDGTLCKNRYPDIGEPIQEVIDKLLEEQRNGAKLILWTCRCDKQLADAVEWCERHGIIFDAVNDHLQELKEIFGNNTRKIFAHQYWDDHAVNIFKELGIVTMPLDGALNNRLKTENRYLLEKIKHLNEELVIQKGLIDYQKAEIENSNWSKSTMLKEVIDNIVFEIVNKPSEFTAEQATSDFLSGSSHRQNEILDIIEKMAVNCDDNNI